MLAIFGRAIVRADLLDKLIDEAAAGKQLCLGVEAWLLTARRDGSNSDLDSLDWLCRLHKASSHD